MLDNEIVTVSIFTDDISTKFHSQIIETLLNTKLRFNERISSHYHPDRVSIIDTSRLIKRGRFISQANVNFDKGTAAPVIF